MNIPVILEDSGYKLKVKQKVGHPCPVSVLSHPGETTVAAILLPVLNGTSSFPVPTMRPALPVVAHFYNLKRPSERFRRPSCYQRKFSPPELCFYSCMIWLQHLPGKTKLRCNTGDFD